MGYFNDYKKITVNTVRTSWHSVRDIHKDIFNKIVSVIEEDVVKKRNYLSLTSLCDMYNKELQEELIHQPEADVSLMTNHQLEEKIVKQFKQIKIVIKKKRKIIKHKNSNLLEQDLKELEENDLIDKVAFILRSTILKMDKTTLPAVMKMEDLINGECTIPEKLDSFFKALIGGKDIRRRDGVNFIGVAFDNFDKYVDTSTGKDTLHDTAGIIYQNVSDDYDIELNSSSISGNLDIPLPPTKEDGLLTRKFQNYRHLIIDCKC
ncbi:uncharacterized protein TNCV_1700931 [Trichonephila clavipes]|nr:uncharacterized protein TNCV_1700931 [Trichonephila clavipes]